MVRVGDGTSDSSGPAGSIRSVGRGDRIGTVALRTVAMSSSSSQFRSVIEVIKTLNIAMIFYESG